MTRPCRMCLCVLVCLFFVGLFIWGFLVVLWMVACFILVVVVLFAFLFGGVCVWAVCLFIFWEKQMPVLLWCCWKRYSHGHCMLDCPGYTSQHSLCIYICQKPLTWQCGPCFLCLGEACLFGTEMVPWVTTPLSRSRNSELYGKQGWCLNVLSVTVSGTIKALHQQCSAQSLGDIYPECSLLWSSSYSPLLWMNVWRMHLCSPGVSVGASSL